MNKTKHVASLFCAAILAIAPILTLACSKKPVVVPEPEPRREIRNTFFGLWEGKDKYGDIYTVNFTSKEWECRVEEGGISRPHYRGTYMHTGMRLDLLIVGEADPKTGGWRPQRGNLEPTLMGVLSGAGRVLVLNIRALTEADLVKKQGEGVL